VLVTPLVLWAAADAIPIEVRGPGLIDCHLYTQAGRFILHLVNLTNSAAWRAPMEDLIPVGPISATVNLRNAAPVRTARLLVSKTTKTLALQGGKATVEVGSILDHEVIVIE